MSTCRVSDFATPAQQVGATIETEQELGSGPKMKPEEVEYISYAKKADFNCPPPVAPAGKSEGLASAEQYCTRNSVDR
ncbi:hypothetical protein ACLOJK_037899 [Asimina triloba]